MVDVLHQFSLLFVAVAAGGGALAASSSRVLPYSLGVMVAGAAVLGLVVLLVEGYVRGPQDDTAGA